MPWHRTHTGMRLASNVFKTTNKGGVMKIFLGLLLVGVSALADQAPDSGQGKPIVIQDGPPAQAYIETALYQYLDKPPYLFIHAETPFFAKRLVGKNVWIALVDFYCGLNEQRRLHCVTVLVFDPSTNKHRFMTPEQLPCRRSFLNATTSSLYAKRCTS
jgi:hypothetical protein